MGAGESGHGRTQSGKDAPSGFGRDGRRIAVRSNSLGSRTAQRCAPGSTCAKVQKCPASSEQATAEQAPAPEQATRQSQSRLCATRISGSYRSWVRISPRALCWPGASGLQLSRFGASGPSARLAKSAPQPCTARPGACATQRSQFQPASRRGTTAAGGSAAPGEPDARGAARSMAGSQ